MGRHERGKNRDYLLMKMGFRRLAETVGYQYTDGGLLQFLRAFALWLSPCLCKPGGAGRHQLRELLLERKAEGLVGAQRIFGEHIAAGGERARARAPANRNKFTPATAAAEHRGIAEIQQKPAGAVNLIQRLDAHVAG